MNLKHSCLNSSSRTHRTRPLLQQTGMPRQLCPTADAQLHAAANAAATSCDHHGGIHFELGIDPEARLLLTLHKLHHVGIADLLAWYANSRIMPKEPNHNSVFKLNEKESKKVIQVPRLLLSVWPTPCYPQPARPETFRNIATFALRQTTKCRYSVSLVKYIPLSVEPRKTMVQQHPCNTCTDYYNLLE